MLFGYARVSTEDQNLELQIDALLKAGCERIFKEKVSGKNTDRPELQKLLGQVRAGDTIMVWKLDRLGRSLKDLINLVTTFEENQISFVSLNDNINTSSPSGRLIFNLFASFAEFERAIIKERTNAGLAAARARGRKGGRPAGLSKTAISKATLAKDLYDKKEKTVDEIAKLLSIGRGTVYNYINQVKTLQEKKSKA
jgi:DNA invertase Pin-like site-specific DNA recombinase